MSIIFPKKIRGFWGGGGEDKEARRHAGPPGDGGMARGKGRGRTTVTALLVSMIPKRKRKGNQKLETGETSGKQGENPEGMDLDCGRVLGAEPPVPEVGGIAQQVAGQGHQPVRQ